MNIEVDTNIIFSAIINSNFVIKKNWQNIKSTNDLLQLRG
jgi:predicted nucleic acid-binding protein